MARKTILCQQCRFADGCPYTTKLLPSGDYLRHRRDCIGGQIGWTPEEKQEALRELGLR